MLNEIRIVDCVEGLALGLVDLRLDFWFDDELDYGLEDYN
jgi:hypothetical protein